MALILARVSRSNDVLMPWRIAMASVAALLFAGQAHACGYCRPQVLAFVFNDELPLRLLAVVAPLVLTVATIFVLTRRPRAAS